MPGPGGDTDRRDDLETDDVAAAAGSPAGPPGPDRDAKTAISLWTPRGIGWSAVLLGFPGALLLAALNWRRMGRPRKAVAHAVAGVIVLWALILTDIGGLGVSVGVVVAIYLWRTQRIDQRSFASAGRVIERSGLLGAVLALVWSLAAIGSGVVVADALGAGGSADRWAVSFGTGAAADQCAISGRRSEFGPTDPIFLAAVLRETVEPGSRVVRRIDGPGFAGIPVAVAVEPPFDCLVSTTSLGPLPPGTYVVRYTDESRPGSPDLAAGSFTVIATKASSSASP